jgi:hypothetical protein
MFFNYYYFETTIEKSAKDLLVQWQKGDFKSAGTDLGTIIRILIGVSL